MRHCVKILLTATLLSGLLIGCEPEPGQVVIPEEPTPEQPQPEEPKLPENPLSTLEGDVEVTFTADNSLSYADCFGNYYHTGTYMWGLYFQNYTSKEQIYVEIMHPKQVYEMPLGIYTASEDIYSTEVLIKGGFDEDGYQSYSWYTRLETDSQAGATAPIFGGEIAIEELGEERYVVTFDLIDDRGNKICGTYDGMVVLEDFRIN